MENVLKIALKVLVIILIVILVVISCVFIRNLVIFSKIRSRGNKILKSDNYHVTINSSMPDYDYSVKNEIYKKDNIQTIYTYNHDQLNEVHWKDYSTEETVSYAISGQMTYDIEFNSELIKALEGFMKLEDFSILENCISNIVEVKDGCYIFKAGVNYEIYYDKDTGDLLKTVTLNEDLETVNIIEEYKFELDTVNDENVAKPSLEE